jgi:phage terminase large subunit GpA-like protein
MHDSGSSGSAARRLCGLGAAALLAGFVAGVVPPPVKTVSAWADEARYVAPESGSPYPGKWDSALVPYLAEIQDCLGFDDPHRKVVFAKSAQVGGSEAGVNLFGYVADHEPSPVLIVLPSLEEASKYNRLKLQPTIEATPALRARIRDVNSRAEDSSTATFKRFRGGFAVITGANSSKGLQMISARVRIYEEVSEYPDDVDGRGEPTAQAEARGKSWSERRPKSFYVSTPGLLGACRISAEYEASDQRRFYVPCPHCGAYQVLQWKNMRWRSEIAPHGGFFACAANGCIIEAPAKRAMVAAGTWIRTYPGDEANPPPPIAFAAEELARWRARGSAGRQPGFHIWQAYSPFVTWETTVAEYHQAEGQPRLLKTFWQQGLGEAWEEKGEAPDHERLFERREKFPARRLVPGILFLTGATDVQGDRLEWAVYGWDRDLSAWLIDGGIIMGDPAGDEVWHAHDLLVAQRYADAWGRAWPVDAWGIDSGYLSNRVYRYARDHVATGRIFALDGRPAWKLPAVGLASVKDVDYGGRKIGAVKLWPVGTWDMKSEVYAALRLTLQGPDSDGRWPAGAMHFPDRCDREFFRQITAEHLADRVIRTGHTVREWKKDQRQRNEQLDLAVYARALAHHLSDALTPDQWGELAAQRVGRPQDVQLDLAAFWTVPAPRPEPPAIAESAPLPRPAATEANGVRPAAGGDWLGGRAGRWL